MLYRFGKAETGINEAIQHRFQAGSKHGFRSFRLFFGFRIEINRNKTIHPPIRQPEIRRRPPDKETGNRGNRDAGKTGMRGKPGCGKNRDAGKTGTREQDGAERRLPDTALFPDNPGAQNPRSIPDGPSTSTFQATQDTPGTPIFGTPRTRAGTADPKCRRPCNTRHTRSRIAQVRTRRASGKNGSMNRNRGN